MTIRTPIDAAVLTAAVLTAVVLSAAAPRALPAQSLDIELLPKVGIATPIGSLTETTELRTALAFGVAAELLLPRAPLNVRANLDHINDAGMFELGAGENRVGTASITAIVGDLVLRPLPATATAQPYFLAGGGVRLYDLRVDDSAGGELAVGETRLTRGTLHVGGGVDVRIGPLALVVEIADYLGTFVSGTDETKLQNDIVGMVGFRVGMF